MSKRTKKVIHILLAVVFCAVFITGGFMLYGKYQMSKIPSLTFEEALAYTTKDNPDKEYRGLGIGTALMKQMLTHLKEKGYKKASLAVQQANYAVKMYQQIGFEIIDKNEEEYIMVCSLQQFNWKERRRKKHHE